MTHPHLVSQIYSYPFKGFDDYETAKAVPKALSIAHPAEAR